MSLGHGSRWAPPCLNSYLCLTMYMEVIFSRSHWETANTGFTGLTATIDFTKKKGGDVGKCPAWFQKL